MERVWGWLWEAAWVVQGWRWLEWSVAVCADVGVVLRHVVRVGGAKQWW